MSKVNERTLLAKQKSEEIMYEMSNLKSHVGYKKVLEMVKDRVLGLDHKILTSNDPNEVFACVKEKNGIQFLVSEVDHLIEEGLKARDFLLKVNLD